MRDSLVVVAVVAALAACTPDTPHTPIFLAPPYDGLPPARPGTTIEPGRPVGLDARQRKTVVVSVQKWMKDPASVQFGTIEAVRNSRGLITVCGEVNGRFRPGRHRLVRPRARRGVSALPRERDLRGQVRGPHFDGVPHVPP